MDKKTIKMTSLLVEEIQKKYYYKPATETSIEKKNNKMGGEQNKINKTL